MRTIPQDMKRVRAVLKCGAIALALALVLASCANQQSSSSARQTQTTGDWTSSPLISRNLRAFASPSYSPAAQANDGTYDTAWRSQGTPAWLAYDLSAVPLSRRSRVLVVWYNESYNYDHTIINTYAYDVPQDYTLEVNNAPGGGDPPSSGWVTLATVQGNHYHSRQHMIEMDNNNWLRLHVSVVDGAPDNEDASLNMDVYSTSAGESDDWIFFGDSITAAAMGHLSVGNTPSFAQLINAAHSNHFPVQEAGGIGYLTSAEGLRYLRDWVSIFPGKYVALSYGTNDANACVDPQTFYNNYKGMVQTVSTAGKVAVIPSLPWGRTENIQRCGPALNAALRKLYTTFGQIVRGPDLWSYFEAHQSLISSDNLHPTDAGLAAYRREWANAMLRSVYSANGSH